MHRVAAVLLAVAVPCAARAEVVRLTEDVATRVVRGWKAELAAREAARKEHAAAEAAHRSALAAFPARKKAHDGEKARWDSCQRSEVAPATARAEQGVKTAMGDPATVEARAKEIAGKMQAAAQRGDLAEVQRLSQQIAELNRPVLAATDAGQADLMAAARRCGPEPAEPRAPAAPPQPGSRFHDVGARAAGLTEAAYRHLEDRLGWALTSDGGVDLQPKMGYVNSEITPFTPAEVTVLRARGRELAAQLRAVHGS